MYYIYIREREREREDFPNLLICYGPLGVVICNCCSGLDTDYDNSYLVVPHYK